MALLSRFNPHKVINSQRLEWESPWFHRNIHTWESLARLESEVQLGGRLHGQGGGALAHSLSKQQVVRGSGQPWGAPFAGDFLVKTQKTWKIMIERCLNKDI